MDVEFNFVIDCKDEELAHYKEIIDFTPEGMERTELGWCLQTYSILVRRGKVFVSCSNCLRKDAINVVHSEHLLRLRGAREHFLVCVQADYSRRCWAHYHLVQNRSQLSADTSFVPFWIQPGLIKRDAARQSVRNVAFAGSNFNGNMAMSEDMWQHHLAPHELHFIRLAAGNWHDLSAVDVLVGIRSFDTKLHSSKPSTKLFNAWHAHIPFVGGYDSAYTQMGTPGEDYLRVKTVEEVISALLTLRDNPALYQKLVENGKKKAMQYNNETTACEWESILSGPVVKRYQQWKGSLFYERLRFSCRLNAGLLKHQSKQIIKKIIKTP